MAMPILATKLYLPLQRETPARRGCLLNSLYAAVAGKLTLISAPVGFGKTTLLSEWLGQQPRPSPGI